MSTAADVKVWEQPRDWRPPDGACWRLVLLACRTLALVPEGRQVGQAGRRGLGAQVLQGGWM
jgi:hypothetical protein